MGLTRARSRKGSASQADAEGLAAIIALPDAPSGHRGPVLRFPDPDRAPAGVFGAGAVINRDLRRSMVPGPHACWEAVEEFALSYDGYSYWSDLGKLAGGSMRAWARQGSLPGTLDELRGCLFYEQRRWHHFGLEPQGRGAVYVRALLDALASLLEDDPPARATPPIVDQAG